MWELFSSPLGFIIAIGLIVLLISTLVSISKSRMPVQDKTLWFILSFSVVFAGAYWIFVQPKVKSRRR